VPRVLVVRPQLARPSRAAIHAQAEEYDPVGRRQLGNFPQAFSHVGLVNTAYNLTPAQTMPARRRHDE